MVIRIVVKCNVEKLAELQVSLRIQNCLRICTGLLNSRTCTKMDALKKPAHLLDVAGFRRTA
jgi:hypothetical protein